MERVRLRRELRACGEESGLQGNELTEFIREELEREDRVQRDKLEREERENEQKRQDEEKERERKRQDEEREIQRQDEKDRLEREEREKERQHKEREMAFMLEMEREKARIQEAARDNPSSPNSRAPSDSGQTPANGNGSGPTLAFPMDAFDPKIEKIDIWLERFEKVAQLYQLPDDQFGLKVVSLLKGTPYTIICQLPPSAQESYLEIKNALLRHYNVTAEAYQQMFRTAKIARHETYAQLRDRLSYLLQRWLTLSQLGYNYEGLNQLILMEQMVDTMPEGTSSFVRQSGASSLEEVIIHADRYTRSQELGKQGKWKTKGQNEIPRTPHQQTDTSKASPSTKPQGQNKYCHHCKLKNSHNTDECRRKASSSKPHSAHVAIVTQKEREETPFHPSPVGKIKVNGKTCTALYDTGLDYSCVVAPHLVRADQLTNDYVDIQCASLAFPTLKLRIANIEIQDCPFVVGTIPAAILDTSAYDLILGCKYILVTPPTRPIIACPVMTRIQTAEQTDSEPAPNPAPAEMRNAQREDTTLATCFAKVNKASDPPKKGDITLKDGILYRVADNDRFQLIVPQRYRQQVLELGHDIAFSGHMGMGATANRITTHYYWKGIDQDIRRYVRSCYVCQKKSSRSYTVPVTLGEMPVVGVPFERIAADILGPLELTKKRNRFILTLVDTCTMWAEAIPLPRIDAKTVAEAFIGVFTRLGIPKQILTDNGSQFCGNLMRDVYKIFQTQHVTTSVYHPQSNGQVERFNGTIISILKKLVEDKPETWDTYVAPALYAYREAPHASTGVPPATLLLGRPISGPLEALKWSWTDETLDETERNASQYVRELKDRLKHGWAVATANLKKARKKQARYHNKNAKDRELEVGDKVLLLLPTGSHKLQISWQGPFTVSKKISRTTYSIQMNGKNKNFHINLLKKFHEREQQTRLMVMTVAEEVESTADLALDYPIKQTETFEQVQVNPALGVDQRKQINQVLERYAKCLTDKPGRTDLIEVDLKLTDHTPIRCKPYPVPLAKEQAIQDEIDTLLREGIIAPSTSPYSAPVVLLRKPSGEHRLCVDLRKINAVTEFQPEPIPDQARLFAKLGKARIFSKCDLSRGFYQLPVRSDVRPYLAFSTHQGHYEFQVLPFGLHNAPSIFSKMMTKLLAPLNNDCILHFMDDILIATSTWEEHVQALQMLFERLQETGLTARPSKCKIGFEELEFLGHTLKHGAIMPEEKNVEKLKKAPRPTTKKNVRSFLGMCAFYQKFIPGFNRIAAPLTDATKKAAPDQVKWTAECEDAFQTLKSKLTTQPILRLPNPEIPFTLRTDASKTAIGAVLLQPGDSDTDLLHPVAYASRKLTPAEQNYSTVEQECLALVWAIQKFQLYLYGKHFTLQCDNQPMLFLATAAKLNAKLMRWSLLLQSYSFHIEFIKGDRNQMADFMSRHVSDKTPDQRDDFESSQH